MGCGCSKKQTPEEKLAVQARAETRRKALRARQEARTALLKARQQRGRR